MIKCKEHHRSHTGVEATSEVATICVDPLCIVIPRTSFGGPNSYFILFSSLLNDHFVELQVQYIDIP